jgi:hypothetical protein
LRNVTERKPPTCCPWSATAPWKNAEELETGAARSKDVGDEDGTLGTYCVYEAESPEALRAHAEKSGFGADEINVVVDTVIIRPDSVAESVAS